MHLEYLCNKKMKILTKIVDLQNELFPISKANKTIGLVPTMGALHSGHASLIDRSVKENDITVVSVFLNPTQFNDKGDFERYPRTLDDDAKLVNSCNADYLFAPTVEEIYPIEDKRVFNFPPQTTVMEGLKRPGHFNGVCQVVSRLFYIVNPTKAYFGEKDWQQIAVIKRLVEYIHSDVIIVECPTVREDDGLAKSSRNKLLTPSERKLAPYIYKILNQSLKWMSELTVKQLHDRVVSEINAIKGLQVEYFSIVDGITLEEVKTWSESSYIVGCITVNCGSTPIRLIDHITYKKD